jgi:hypothetical protein
LKNHMQKMQNQHPPRIKRKTVRFTSKANLAVIDHRNAIYDTKVMLGADGNCSFRCAKSWKFLKWV